MKRSISLLILFGFISVAAAAREPVGQKAVKSAKTAQYRDVCANSTSAIDQAINNVRARLLGAGDCWWDLSRGRYIVPKVDPASGLPEVSSLFAGAVWIGGLDPGNNLKLACQTYRNDGRNDFWPGPINVNGFTDAVTCANWDRHFRVPSEEIRKHLANIAVGNLDPDAIPKGVKGWPASGNEFFSQTWGFELPFTQQALAGFYDRGPTFGSYDPLEGDYPSIEIRGCALDRYPDEMIFWIYNDHGGGQPHARTNGRTIQMEIQVQAFGFVSNGELHDMTFQRYKLINRATDRIDSTFFAMWVDPDLGCDEDDYVGCDTARSLMYVYNQDEIDGNPGATCPSGASTYGYDVPILGIDFFRGPLGVRSFPDIHTIDPNDYIDYEFELGMSSFVYYNRGGSGFPNGTTDPAAPQEYYNYLTGSWRDGTPITKCGSGYNPGNPNAERVKYIFTDPPNDPDGCSMCTAGLQGADVRTLQASGPFTLKPGAVNELIIGIPWVPDIEYPCPDLEGLFRADAIAQKIFDSCFDHFYGPDAPNVDWVELDKEVIAVLTNDPFWSNNEGENYKQQDPFAPAYIKQSTDPAIRETGNYRFEGYLLYQLTDENVPQNQFTNPEKSRLVQQVDLKNGIRKIYNWEKLREPNTQKIVYRPVLAVEGADQGIRHSFSIKEDKFASGNDKGLINHRKYYYAVVAYAHNNYKILDPFTDPVLGQDKCFLSGIHNVQVKTVIPRPVVDRSLRAAYGDGVIVARLEGQGAGGNFLELDAETEKRVLESGFDSTLTYKSGRGPIQVTIFNPLEVKDGTYELALVDQDLTDNQLAEDARWELRKLPDGGVIHSEKSIQLLNEQIVREYGFSVSIAQTAEPGQNPHDRNGGIGAEISYADPSQPWLQGIPDGFGGALFNYVKTGALEEDEALDPTQGLSTLGNGWFVPYTLVDSDLEPEGEPFITPAWTSSHNNAPNSIRRERLQLLPNVDIVLTSDKSKWSRCAVIETASAWVSTDTSVVKIQNNGNKGRLMFDTRYALSVGKNDTDLDGLPDPDGAINPSVQGIPVSQQGKPVYGMGWFPGYAVDVETGRRLNIFFGENSGYSRALNPTFTGRDMLWNPSSQFFAESLPGLWGAMLGGHHWIYVMHTTYDSCEALRRRLTPEFTTAPPLKNTQIQHIAWTGMVQLAPGFKLTSLSEGLIPTETRIRLRVDNPYQTWFNDADANKRTGHPRYQFTIVGGEAETLTEVEVGKALDSIKMVPNPYYGFSEYETSKFTNTVKITNLPGKCTVTIYSLDGKFIRQYNRDETYLPYQQISPAIEWDLKNSKAIPVASGVYLVHVNAPGLGERTLKWFGIGRQYDPSGL
ncbi:MAG TPA: hypothetical protein DCF33_07210 [Saprospirales bacterium]|nr:hypothetical protein [Saprospirales bacterium]